MEKDIKEFGKISDIGYKEIKKNLPTINDLIKDVLQNNDKSYLSFFYSIYLITKDLSLLRMQEKEGAKNNLNKSD